LPRWRGGCLSRRPRAAGLVSRSSARPRGRTPRQWRTTNQLCADRQCCSLHAAVRCDADERQRLEQLCRYITRQAPANERVQINGAGQVDRLKSIPNNPGFQEWTLQFADASVNRPIGASRAQRLRSPHQARGCNQAGCASHQAQVQTQAQPVLKPELRIGGAIDGETQSQHNGQQHKSC